VSQDCAGKGGTVRGAIRSTVADVGKGHRGGCTRRGTILSRAVRVSMAGMGRCNIGAGTGTQRGPSMPWLAGYGIGLI
jgi:hypothetical protein